MKSICFVCYDLSIMGGAEKVATEVAAAMSDRYKVHMVSLTGSEPFLPLDKNISYTNLHLDLSRLRKGILPATKALRSYYKQNNIYMSFLEGNYTGLICGFTSLFTGTKQVFCDHGSLMSQWNQKDIRTIRRMSSKLCDYTIVLTEESMNDYINMLHVNPKKIAYIHNWIDDIPEKSTYNCNSTLIMSAGRFALEKQFHSLLPEVAKIVKQQHRNWQWHIYGDGEYFEEAKKRISEMGLEDYVILKGRVNDLYQKYKDYSIYVMTSDREGMPLVLLEAKAHGIPIVVFDIKTGPSEIVRNDIDGYLLPYGDVKAMGNSICRLIENKQLREKMSSFSYDDANRFSKKEILNKWIDFVESH